MDKISGYLEVGRNERGEVIINHPDLKPDTNGVGHIVFSPAQARDLAGILIKHADGELGEFVQSLQIEELSAALTESVKLQSFYAEQLNVWDGGKRMQFNSAEEWLKRLRKLKKRKP